jgi:hypothetical protein
MHSMSLNKFFDFMQVLNIINTNGTNIEHFSKHMLFSTIYLQQEQKLNHRNYSRLHLNMRNFLQSTENVMHMYAKFGYFTFCVFL